MITKFKFGIIIITFNIKSAYLLHLTSIGLNFIVLWCVLLHLPTISFNLSPNPFSFSDIAVIYSSKEILQWQLTFPSLCVEYIIYYVASFLYYHWSLSLIILSWLHWSIIKLTTFIYPYSVWLMSLGLI